MYHTLFIHLSVDEHLGSFQFGAIVNNAAMNICVQFFTCTYVFTSLGYVLGVNAFILYHSPAPCQKGLPSVSQTNQACLYLRAFVLAIPSVWKALPPDSPTIHSLSVTSHFKHHHLSKPFPDHFISHSLPLALFHFLCTYYYILI